MSSIKTLNGAFAKLSIPGLMFFFWVDIPGLTNNIKNIYNLF